MLRVIPDSTIWLTVMLLWEGFCPNLQAVAVYIPKRRVLLQHGEDVFLKW
jgi:hypothetical protein